MLPFALLLALATLWPVRAPQIAQSGRALELFDRNGARLGTLYGRDERHAVSVPLARISPAFLAALVATEDRRFFVHGAVDAPALLRAGFVALAAHRPPGGASTISMQLARLVTPVAPTLLGKLQETVGAARLESGLTKAQILEAYANRIPMGSNLYGVQAAARTYLGVDASDLDLAQSALLAALPNDPVRLDPYRHWNALKARQRIVLARMQSVRTIDETTARRAFAERIALQPPQRGIVSAPHFLFWLAPQVAAGRTSVTTTLDLEMQRFVQAQTRSVVAALGAHNVHDAAALVIDNRTAQVLAYVGSPDYFADEIFGRNDGVQALRQPGSALKPFLYELALERRIVRPTTILQDVPAAYALAGARLYAPQDYSRTFRGPVRVRVALANSLNVPAVRVLERVGVPAFLERLRTLGFSHLEQSPDYYGLGLTLGGGEVSLFELARAYATLARGGAPTSLVSTRDGLVAAPIVTGDDALALPIMRDGTLASSIVTRDATLQSSETNNAGTYDASWALVTDMLADAHARAAAFGVDSVLRLPFPTAVKTGTSSDYRDTWTVGFSRDYTVAVWVGNFDGSPMRDVSGVSGAGPLWNRIMLHLHERREPQAFHPPRGYVRHPICATTGRRPGANCNAVVSEYLDARDLVAYDVRHPSRSTQALPTDITFPHDGDRFVYFAGAGSSQRLRFTFGAGASHPTLNGRALVPTDDDYLWPLSLGSYTLRATAHGDAVHFSVVPPPQHRAGFTLRADSSDLSISKSEAR